MGIFFFSEIGAATLEALMATRVIILLNRDLQRSVEENQNDARELRVTNAPNICPTVLFGHCNIHNSGNQMMQTSFECFAVRQ